MDIRNPTEFRNFVQATGIANIHPDIAMVLSCITDYERGCNCWKNNDKDKIYQVCKANYVKAVTLAVNNFKAHFMQHTIDQTITFFLDGKVIGSMRR